MVLAAGGHLSLRLVLSMAVITRTVDAEMQTDAGFGSPIRTAQMPPMFFTLRGGATPVNDVIRAKVLLLAANACDGTYTVTMRGIGSAANAEPLGFVFITFVRYGILCLFACITRFVHQLQGKQNGKHDTTNGLAQDTQGAWQAASELALYNICCGYTCSWGTLRVAAAMSEVFQSTEHIFVILISCVLGTGTAGHRTKLATALVLCGTCLTAFIDGKHNGVSGITLGADGIWSSAAIVVSALFSSTYRVRKTVHLKRYSVQTLQVRRMTMIGIFAFVGLLVDIAFKGESAKTVQRISHIKPGQWGCMAGGVFITSVISSTMQYEALRTLSAVEAQPYSAVQPVFAAIFAWIALGETVSLGTYLGGLLIVIAMAMVSFDHYDLTKGSATAAAVDTENRIAQQGAAAPLLKPPLELVEGKVVDETIMETISSLLVLPQAQHTKGYYTRSKTKVQRRRTSV